MLVLSKRVPYLLLAIVALSSSASAQTAVPSRLTLEEALSRATDNSHRLAEMAAREAASGAVVEQRERADLPIVSALAGYQRTNHVTPYGFVTNGRLQILYPDVPDNWRARLDLQWPIYTGGRTQALEAAARAEQGATGKDLAAARADLRLETTRAFWALVTATESVTVVDESVKRIEAQLGDVRARYDAGFLPPNDVFTVESRVAQQRTLLIQARNQRDGARAELARLMGVPLDAAFEPDGNLTSPGQAVPNPLLAPARAEHDAQMLRIEAADARIDSARADSKPVVFVGGGYDIARPNPRIFPREDVWHDSWDVGVNVSLTLWNGGRTAAEVSEARFQADAARARLAELDSLIALDVQQRRLDLDSSRAQVDTASAAVRAASEARRVVAERFAVGVATSTDLLDAQVDQLQAELNRTNALANVKLAEAQLARALGQ